MTQQKNNNDFRMINIFEYFTWNGTRQGFVVIYAFLYSNISISRKNGCCWMKYPYTLSSSISGWVVSSLFAYMN